MMNFRKSTLVVAIASSLALAGCGSGGSGSSGGSSGGGGGGNETPGGTQTSVSGSAVKGPLRNAEVRIIEVGDDGAEIRTVAETQTNDQGEYSVELSGDYQGGLLKIVVRADGDTTMVCDAPKGCGDTAFRGIIEQDLENLELRAYSEKSEGSDKVETSVSTWSTLAADRAEELAGAAGNLRNASRIATSDVSGLVGFDIAKTKARALTDDASRSGDEAISAVMNAAAAELIFGDKSEGSVSEKLIRLTSSIKEDLEPDSQSEEVESPVGRLVRAAREVADSPDAGLDTDARNAVSNLDEDYEASTDEDLIVSPGATQEEKIGKFKKFVATTRAWVQSIEDLNNDELTAAIDLDVTAAENALRGIQEGQLQFVVSAINAAFNQLVENPELLSEGGEQQFELVSEEGVTVASGTLTVDNRSGLLLNIDGTVTNGGETSIPFNLQVDTSISAEVIDVNAGALKQIAASTGVVVSGQVGDENTDSLTLNEVALNLELANALTSGATGGFDESEFLAQFQSASVSGEIEAKAESGDTFAGAVSAKVVRLEESGRLAQGTTMEPFSLKSAGVSGSFAGASGSQFHAELRLNLSNASTFDALAWSEYSNNDVTVSVPVSYEDLLPLADGMLADDSYRSFIAVNPYYESYYADDAAGYRLTTVDYVPSQEVKTVTRILPAEEAVQMVDRVRTSLLENTFRSQSISFKSLGGTGETTSYQLSDLFNGGMGFDLRTPMNQGGINENEIALGVRVVLDAPLLEDTSYAELDGNSVDLAPGIRITGTLQDSGESQEFRVLIIRDRQVIPDSDSLVSNILEDLYPTEGSGLQFFAITERNNGMGSVEYTIESNRENVTACGADPVAFVGAGATKDSCGALLERIQDFRELAANEVEQVKALRDEALVKRFGMDLTSKLVIDDFQTQVSRRTNRPEDDRADESFMEVEATFPDLESEEKFADVSVTLSANINLQELPAAKATVTVNRNTYLGGNLLANVRWNGGNYSVAMQADNVENPNSYTGRIFNTQGYELTIGVTVDDNGEITAVSGDALLNGEDIGDLELRDNGVVVLVFPNNDENEIVSLL